MVADTVGGTLFRIVGPDRGRTAEIEPFGEPIEGLIFTTFALGTPGGGRAQAVGAISGAQVILRLPAAERRSPS